MNFPIHDHPHDYWRFTPEGFRSILGLFAWSFVGFVGEADFPHTVVGVASKKLLQRLPSVSLKENLKNGRRVLENHQRMA